MRRSIAWAALAGGAAACTGGEQRAKVEITAPASDASVSAPVTVSLTVTGVQIVPASEPKPGSGHHHLFVDVDVPSWTEKIPAGVSNMVHLGKGQSQFTFDSLPPGKHRIVAVVADADHVPLKPPVADTVEFMVN